MSGHYEVFRPMWLALNFPPVEHDNVVQFTLLVTEPKQAFPVIITYGEDCLMLQPERGYGKGGGVIALNNLGHMFFSFAPEEDVCHGKDWAELAADLRKVWGFFPELTLGSYGWLRDFLDFVAGNPTPTQFRVQT